MNIIIITMKVNILVTLLVEVRLSIRTNFWELRQNKHIGVKLKIARQRVWVSIERHGVLISRQSISKFSSQNVNRCSPGLFDPSNSGKFTKDNITRHMNWRGKRGIHQSPAFYWINSILGVKFAKI
jgi:hypothetical protein